MSSVSRSSELSRLSTSTSKLAAGAGADNSVSSPAERRSIRSLRDGRSPDVYVLLMKGKWRELLLVLILGAAGGALLYLASLIDHRDTYSERGNYEGDHWRPYLPDHNLRLPGGPGVSYGLLSWGDALRCRNEPENQPNCAGR